MKIKLTKEKYSIPNKNGYGDRVVNQYRCRGDVRFTEKVIAINKKDSTPKGTIIELELEQHPKYGEGYYIVLGEELVCTSQDGTLSDVIHKK